MRTGIICNLAGGAVGGQTAKTKRILDYLTERLDTEVFDLYPAKSRHNIFAVIAGAVKVCRNTDNLVVILNIRGTHLVLTALRFFGLHKTHPIYDVAIGGKRHTYAAKHPHFRKVEKITAKLFVESSVMAEEFQRLGIDQAEVLPNCKDMVARGNIILSPYHNPLKLCTFSRVVEDKGIDTAIETVRLLNEAGVNAKLHIYGPVDPDYQETFDALLKKCSDGKTACPVKYQGIVQPESAYDVLLGYHILLMPTRHDEGFPGTFLDAMEAGIAILAPRLLNFRDIVKDGENGYLLDENSPEAYASTIRKLIDTPGLLLKLRKNAYRMADEYSSERVLGKLIEHLGA